MSAQLVVNAKNDLFGEPVGGCERTGKGRASLEIRSEYDPVNEPVHVAFQDGATEQVKL